VLYWAKEKIIIKDTFCNLNTEKRNKILAAAKQEFSRVAIYDSKISNIINAAEIPRGSFYQYFDTVNDVILAVMEERGVYI
jgi:AcrR family transcriptional regulator